MLKAITREIIADLETPVSTYLKLSGEGPTFLLESVTGGENVARYSFIGLQPSTAFVIRDQTTTVHSGPDLKSTTTHTGDPFSTLRNALASYSKDPPPGLPRLVGGLVGYLSYDAVRYFEPNVDLPLHELPDGIFLLCDTLLAFDHTRGRLLAITYAEENSTSEKKVANERLNAIEHKLTMPLPKTSDIFESESASQQSHTKTSFQDMVLKAKEHIMAGDILQVVLSQKFTNKTRANPFSIYRTLRRINPSPYMFFFDFGDLNEKPFQLIGASPEVHVRMENDRAILRPIAGTRPRGSTEEKDIALATELLEDEKERAEHVMLIDLARNDLGRVCNYGSVELTDMMQVERYSHVMHIVSQVEGDLRAEMDAFDLLAATFPAGTVSGAPKVRAMQIIAELEQNPRGPYAGIVGYVGFDGSMDTCIALRTLYVQDQWVTAQAGAGIVADSNPDNEYKETLDKVKAISLAVEQAEDKDRT
ncbi:MAG: anthranilate synthase component I [Anaerolineaceae bacterium]|nr:anthranilate synthase component I [Anaerolineaceae bacterium]|tara:strand:- start:130293 stop:131723 length:1431 start_codon:yes stop_codon:yes gene_type:complete